MREEGSELPSRSDGLAPGERLRVQLGGGRDPEETSPPRAAPDPGTECKTCRRSPTAGGRSTHAETQALASGRCNSPESDWVGSHSVNIPRTVETWGPHSWS